jgi:S1-C subfamily serine protease
MRKETALRSERGVSALCDLSEQIADLVAAALPAVTTLSGVTADMRESSGSGFAIDGLGHLLTNHHVTRDLGKRITATLHGGEDVLVEPVGADPVTDLAVLRLTDGAPAWLEVRSERPRLGELCLAIGSPLGEFAESISLGVVSGLDRSLPSADGRWPMEHMIQTDAAINPGNSGGPLLDMAGRVIGVNESGRTDGQNISFAIPGETISLVATELIEHGSVARAALGVVVVSKNVSERGRTRRRLIVSKVNDTGPFREGDALLSVGGQPVRDRGDLFRCLTRDLIGIPTPVEVIRNGARTTLDISPSAATSTGD